MTTFDIFVSFVVGISLVFSLIKGFVREIFSLLAYVGGYLTAVKYQDSLAQIFMESIPSKPIAQLAAFASIYIVTAIIISLMGKIAKGMLGSGTDLSMFDRLLGGVVGLARGVAIMIAITFPLKFFPEVSKKFTEDSYTAPYLAKALDFVNQNAGTLNIRKKLSEFDMEGAKEKFKDLKEMKDLKDTFDVLKDKMPDNNKPLDKYSPEDQRKLEEILKAFDDN
jgi:membrane protein required for colicin V production